MKLYTKKSLILLLTMGGFASVCATQGGNFGAGLRLGSPAGLDFKYKLNPNNALGFALGFGSPYGDGRYGYNDTRCYDPGFYDRNQGYCDGIRFDYFGRQSGYASGYFHVHGDYLFHNYNVINAPFPIPLYYGGGIQYEHLRHYDAWLGARGTVGLAFMPINIRFDFFVELTPLFWVMPFPDFSMYGGAGARFWF